MPQACPNQYAEEAVEEERVKLLLRQLLMAVKFVDHKVCQRQTNTPKQGVPAQGDGA